MGSETGVGLTVAERSAIYRKRHPERVKAAQKAWRVSNPEKVKARNAKTNRARSKEEHRDYMKRWRKQNPDAAKSIDLKKAYGIDLTTYQAMLARQGGRCAICRKPPKARALAVDHDHTTGVVRDLLCHQCNTAIGLMNESPERLRALSAYLQRWGRS